MQIPAACAASVFAPPTAVARATGDGEAFGRRLAALPLSDGRALPPTVGPARTDGAWLVLHPSAPGPPPRRVAVKRADRLLGSLDKLQMRMIDDADPQDALEELTALLGTARPRTDDPELDRLLDAVELRAAVELAKLEVEASGGGGSPPRVSRLPGR